MKTLKKVLKAILIVVVSLVAILIIAVGIIIYPIVTTKTEMTTSEERIHSFPDRDFPITNKATIYWNENLIPFIEAESDEDAAFLMGAVHAHLRLGQMELFKMVAQGRLSEMAGPLVTQVDHGLRILDIDKSVKQIVKHQDEETRLWVQSYTEGINWYMDHMEEPPPEYRLLNIPLKKWTPEDVYRLARLASADLTWGVYIQTLLLTKNEGWEKTWEFFLKKGQRSIPSFTANNAEAVYQIFNHISKSGSNSLVVSGDKSFNGNALMANDPHLGIFAPNMWFLIGIKSPSFHSVGMQIPGIPFIALGRNPDIAWGGTNMRSISSHLIELTEEELKNARIYTDTIKRRFWFDKIITIRETEYGPVITDAPFLKHVNKPVAIQWMGHNETNELRSFLNGSKARNFEEFRAAFRGYAVSGQNLVYADNKGNIGQIAAYTQPVLQDPDQTLSLIKPIGNPVTGGIDSWNLPYS
ncbi:MAG: penicillin acylase family protein, partial [Bacteroidales bacterium]